MDAKLEFAVSPIPLCVTQAGTLFRRAPIDRFRPFSDAHLSMLSVYVNNKCGRSVSSRELHAARSIYFAKLKADIMIGYAAMIERLPWAVAAYDKGQSILDISAELGMPPSLVIAKIHLTSRPHPRDIAQLELADANDASSAIYQKQIQNVALTNESVFAAALRERGLVFKTERELSDEQHDSVGRAVATPDVLFESPVTINGTTVNWIDYKDYAGTTLPPLYGSNRRQAARYNEIFGPGAIAYKYSYTAGMSIPGTLLLDASTVIHGYGNFLD